MPFKARSAQRRIKCFPRGSKFIQGEGCGFFMTDEIISGGGGVEVS